MEKTIKWLTEKTIKWLNFDSFEFKMFVKEILDQCTDEDEVDILCLKMESCVEQVREEKLEELEESLYE